MKRKTDRKRRISPVKYLNSKVEVGFIRIETEKGELWVPRIRPDDVENMKAEGWHYLADEYYNVDPVDLLIIRMYSEPPVNRYKEIYDRPLDQDTGWWHYRCGEIVPPYEWDGHGVTTATDYVVAWKPHKGETRW